MSNCRIASVHFAPVTVKRNYRGQAYTIPACTLGGEPNILEVRDLIQRDWGSMLAGTNKRQEHRWPVLGEEIANCLVGEWTGTTTVGLGMNPLCHPGIWIVRDRLPATEKTQKLINEGGYITYEERLMLDADNRTSFRAASPDECREMWLEDLGMARLADRRYAEWCWADGNRISDNDKHNQLIPPNYKLAARMYGLDASWLKEAASQNSMPCPSCEKLVSKSTIVCQFCQQPVNMERWAAFQAQKDVALRDAKKLPLQPPVTAAGQQHAAA